MDWFDFKNFLHFIIMFDFKLTDSVLEIMSRFIFYLFMFEINDFVPFVLVVGFFAFLMYFRVFLPILSLLIVDGLMFCTECSINMVCKVYMVHFDLEAVVFKSHGLSNASDLRFSLIIGHIESFLNYTDIWAFLNGSIA